MVSKRPILDLMVALWFSSPMMVFFPASILLLSSVILFWMASRSAFAFAAASAISCTWISVSFLSVKISCFSCSLPAISSSRAALRLFRWFSLPWAELICSFKTLISPSNLPRIRPVSVSCSLAASIAASRLSISCWIRSYSSLIPSYFSPVSPSSVLARLYFSSAESSCSLSLLFSNKNTLISKDFNSSFFLR